MRKPVWCKFTNSNLKGYCRPLWSSIAMEEGSAITQSQLILNDSSGTESQTVASMQETVAASPKTFDAYFAIPVVLLIALAAFVAIMCFIEKVRWKKYYELWK